MTEPHKPHRPRLTFKDWQLVMYNHGCHKYFENLFVALGEYFEAMHEYRDALRKYSKARR